MTLPRVTVIIVAYNSRSHFSRLKTALERQTLPFKLMVLDNASRCEDRADINDFPAGAELFQSEKNLGFAGGNNFVAEKVTTPFIALLNPDAFPEPDWLAALLDAAERHPNAGAIGSLQISAADPNRLDGFGDCYAPMGAYWRGGYGAPVESALLREGEVFSACAAAALYRTDAWREVGGFDSDYFCYCEDVDLCFRLRLLGWRVIQTHNAIVYHVGGGSSRTPSRFSDYYAMRNGIWTFHKNVPALLYWFMTPIHVLLLMRYLLGSVRNGRWAGVSSGIYDGLITLPRIWRSRMTIQRARKIGTAEIARAMTWSCNKLLRGEPDVRTTSRDPMSVR